MKRIINAKLVRCSFLGVGLTAVMSGAIALGAILEGPYEHYSAGANAGTHTYYFLSQQPWDDAEAEAVSLGGHLVTINDASEQNWLFDTFSRQPEYGHTYQGQPGDYSIHIGFTDRETEGQWQWISGEPVDYTNWNGGEPNNVDDEDYAHMMDGWEYGNHWADEDADHIQTDGNYLYAIAEVAPVPEPSTFIIWSLLGITCYWKRRSR